jgi:hypothetical protein
MRRRKGDKFTGSDDLSLLPELWKMLQISASFLAFVPGGLKRYLHRGDGKEDTLHFRVVGFGPYPLGRIGPRTQAPRRE